VQAAQALGGEGAQGIADGLGATAEGSGDPGGALAPVAVQHDLAAAQGEGVGRAEALPEGGTLGFGQRPDEQRRFHASFYVPDARGTDCLVRLH
jgi:hypothetical protein